MSGVDLPALTTLQRAAIDLTRAATLADIAVMSAKYGAAITGARHVWAMEARLGELGGINGSNGIVYSACFSAPVCAHAVPASRPPCHNGSEPWVTRDGPLTRMRIALDTDETATFVILTDQSPQHRDALSADAALTALAVTASLASSTLQAHDRHQRCKAHLSVVAHDVRGDLQVIAMSSALLRDAYSPAPTTSGLSTRALLDRLDRASHRIRCHIDALQHSS